MISVGILAAHTTAAKTGRWIWLHSFYSCVFFLLYLLQRQDICLRAEIVSSTAMFLRLEGPKLELVDCAPVIQRADLALSVVRYSLFAVTIASSEGACFVCRTYVRTRGAFQSH